jgi:hypothetical protein
MSLTKDFCHCVKKVRKTIKLRRGQPVSRASKESAAIAVCVRSVLQTKGLTLKKVRCLPKKKMRLFTQKLRK